MTTDHDESGLIRSWLDGTYEAERDAQPFLDRALDEVPLTPQRRRRLWWLPGLRRSPASLSADHTTDYQPSPIPARNGHSPTVLGRTQSMLSPVKAITAGALVFAIGGALLIAQPFDQQEGSVPGAAEDEVATEHDSSFFQGTLRVLNYTDFGEKTEVEGGKVLEELRGQSYEGVVEATDERVAGTLTGTLNQDTHLMPPDWLQPALSQWGTDRIENDGGAWQCTWTGGEMQFMKVRRLSWCIGEGGYDGHAMRMLSTKSSDGVISVEGLSWRGNLPPLPGLPEPSTD